MISIKPRHFVDIITALGQGVTHVEPHPYGHAVHTVTAQVLDNPDVVLRMELGADDICRPCIHNVDGLCDDTMDTSWRALVPQLKREYNLLIDQRWCDVLGVQQETQITAREMCQRIRESIDRMDEIYVEIPQDHIRQRRENLTKGTDAFLTLYVLDRVQGGFGIGGRRDGGMDRGQFPPVGHSPHHPA